MANKSSKKKTPSKPKKMDHVTRQMRTYRIVIIIVSVIVILSWILSLVVKY